MIGRNFRIVVLLSLALVTYACNGIGNEKPQKAKQFEIGHGVIVPNENIKPPERLEGINPIVSVLGAPNIYRKNPSTKPLPNVDKVTVFSSGTKYFDASSPSYPKPIAVQSKSVVAPTPTTFPATSSWRENGGKSVFYTARDGLPTENNNVIVCGPDGAIWGGSRWRGAWKYDGYHFTYFDQSAGLIDYAVIDMLIDRDGDVWFGMATGLSKYDGIDFTHYLGKNEISQKRPTKLVEDPEGNIWVGSNEGLYKIDKSQNTIKHFNTAHGLLDDEVSALLFDREGNLWIAHNFKGISRMTFFSEEKKEGYQIQHFEVSDKFVLHKVQCMHESRQGQIFVGTDQDLIQLNKSDSEVSDAIQLSVYNSSALGMGFIFDLAEDHRGRIWVASANRVAIIYPEKNGQKQSISFVEQTDIPLIDHSARSITIDHQQNIWLGHSDVGVTKIPMNDAIESHLDDFGISGRIESISEDASGDIWFTMKTKGLFCLKTDRTSGEEILLQYSTEQGLPNVIYQVTFDHDQNLWLTSRYDLFRIEFSEKNGRGDIFQYGPNQGLPTFVLYQLLVDSKGDLWIANNSLSPHDKAPLSKGGSAFRWDGDHFYKYTSEQGLYQSDVNQIYEDEMGNYWFHSLYNGLTKHIPGSENTVGTWVHYPHNDPNYGQFYESTILANGLWYTAPNTILEMSAVPRKLEEMALSVLPIDRTINGDIRKRFLKNEKGQLWVASNFGLEFFDPEVDENGQQTYRSKKIFRQDGLPIRMLTVFKQLSDGKMWLGTSDDLISVETSSFIAKNDNIDISIFRAFRKNENINVQKLKDLTFKENYLRFEFNVTEVNQPHNVYYRYKLDGFDDLWSSPSTQTVAIYPKLPNGHFNFLVQARIGIGDWGSTYTEPVYISPPWWRSWWAYAIYTLLLLATIYAIWKNKLNQLNQKNLIEKEQMALEHLRVVDETKTNFFTNLSHEFRTPLTVILGMSGEIEKPSKAKKLIQQSGQNLMRLVNQMLDFSKMEAGQLRLNLKPGELISYIHYLLESFHSLAEYKKIQLSFESEVEKLVMDYDEDKIHHIISNLISNAIKFTPIGGMVDMKLTTEKNHLFISILDTGIGISGDKLPLIFDRFYQGQEAITRGTPGSGIGLSFTKQLVTLMSGKIEVQSTEGKGSNFTVTLPIHLAEVTEEPISRIQTRRKTNNEILKSDADMPAQLAQEERPQLLLIEDNPEVVEYVRHVLKKKYQVTIAEDGQQGIEKAVELIPDIIISDVMMPFKDGFEVTDFLKNDERTSHIPIILLTAKADAASRLEGLKRKADAYLAKPFDKTELLIRLENMIELRQRMQARYRQSIGESVANGPEMKYEDAFLTRVNEMIERHISDSNFVVEELAQEIGMSRTHLYRKLKALTNQSTVAYLRSYRLKRGKMLLSKGDLNVSEVAYQVGYSDPSYFSRVFSKEFGILPTEV